MLHAAPVSHGTASVGLAHLSVGAAHAFPFSDSFDAGEIFRAIEHYRVTSSFLAPTMIQMLLAAGNREGRDLSSLKNIIYGGGPMYREVLTEALATFGPVFGQIYGQGEAPMTCAGLTKAEHDLSDPEKARRLSSVGREMPAVEIRVVDDKDREVPQGEHGEIVVRSDLVMAGYWNRPDATAETLRGGWLHTGDVGCFDEGGYLFITDRLKDMIISGGTNIYPREIEEVLLAHPDVAEVAVVGRPDPIWGEAVTAFVVAKGPTPPEAQTLIDWCRDRIASFKKPKSVHFLDELPKSALGKVLKRELRDRLSLETKLDRKDGTA
jgi:long-chain acyl-CoA synthetase